MTSEKEIWEQMIGAVLLVFATYTITLNLISEGYLIHFFESNTVNAIFYAGILDTMIVYVLRWNIKLLKKQGKLE